VVLLSADRVDVLPNSAQIDGLTEKREFARLDQIVRVITAMACLRGSVRQQARRDQSALASGPCQSHKHPSFGGLLDGSFPAFGKARRSAVMTISP